MCGGGKPPKPDTSAQEASLQLQREQMAMQQEQMALQQQQFKEQLAISSARPPQAPERTATTAASAIEMPTATGAAPNAAAPSQVRAGLGRRKLRADYRPVMAGGAGGLSIPAV